MNVLSLFAGIGGLDLGLERAGMTVVGQVEIDPFCRRVLEAHWPEVPRHDDVRTCVEWWLGQSRPAVDVVCGGFPCQPFSTAGLRLGVADERWGWPWFAEVVRVLRPGWVIVENVAALLAWRDAFGTILADLAAGGYDIEWDCIPAAAVGAPHLRDRLFLVAHADGQHKRHQPVAIARGSSAAIVGADGETQRLAHTQGDGRQAGRAGRPAGDGASRPAVTAPRLAWTRPDAVSEGRGSWWALTGRQGAPRLEDKDRPEPSGGAWWASEPDVGRVAYGVPQRVDRLRGLGNAVVPQVAEHIGRLVIAAAP